MQQLLNGFTDPSFLIDLIISLMGLVFMCALTYAMRWLPGEASESRISLGDVQMVTVLPETEEMGYDNTVSVPVTPRTEIASNALATAE